MSVVQNQFVNYLLNKIINITEIVLRPIRPENG